MESDRHKFMRELLELCERHDVVIGRGGISIDKANHPCWIDNLTTKDGVAIGYWDGERHEVQL